jgi:hypothetical protein
MAKEMRRRQIEKALRRHGCEIKSDTGKHTKWICPCGQHSANVPRHTTISPGVVADHSQAHGVPTNGMAAMSNKATKTYTVRAKRWARGWELHIDDIGVTQSRSLGEAESMARDYIALDRDVPPESFALKILPEVGGGLDTDIREAREIVTEAAELQQRAAERSRRVARRLKSQGLTGRDIARVLGVSPQRVSQLLSSSPD